MHTVDDPGTPPRRAINPVVLLILGGVALVVFSAIAIYFAVGYQPDSGAGDRPATTTAVTSTAGR